MSSPRSPLLAPSLARSTIHFLVAALAGLGAAQVARAPRAIRSEIEPSWESRSCRSRPPGPVCDHIRIDFDEEPLAPLAGGARVRERTTRCEPARPARTCTDWRGFSVRRRPDPRLIAETIGYNVGEYRRCYRDALARRPGLGGAVKVEARFAENGVVESSRVVASTVGEPALEGCLATAMAELWIEPELVGSETTITWTFRLVPSPIPPQLRLPAEAAPELVARGADEALRRGDPHTALRRYHALARQRPDDPRACGWHAGALRAALEVEPWIGPRVERAADAVIDAYALTPTAACLAAATPALQRVVAITDEHVRHAGIAWLDNVMLGRYHTRIGGPPGSHDDGLLHAELAQALYERGRYAAAAEAYRTVAADASVDTRTRQEARAMAAYIELRH